MKVPWYVFFIAAQCPCELFCTWLPSCSVCCCCRINLTGAVVVVDDALLHHLVVACVLCKPVLLWQWLRMARAMTSLACLTHESKLHVLSYCSALFLPRDNGIAVANRLWNVTWRRMLRPLFARMIQEIHSFAREDDCPHSLALLDFADAAGHVN